MEHIPLTCTDYQRGNLKKLADYLFALPDDYDKFNMIYIFSTKADAIAELYPDRYKTLVGESDYKFSLYQVEPHENRFHEALGHCGTVACAIGHAPFAGIPYKKYEAWEDLASQEFGYDYSYPGSFLFGPTWGEFKATGTAKHAAARIYYALDNGFPKDDIFYGDYWAEEVYEKLPYLEYLDGSKELV